MKFPHSFNFTNRTYLTYAVRDSLRRAKYAIAISESTKRDLVSLFGVSPDKVRVIYCGTDIATNDIQNGSRAFMPGANGRERPSTSTEDKIIGQNLRAKHALPEKFILFLGTIEPRKNIARLIRAFAEAKREAKLPHQLVLAGAYGWKYAEINRAARDAGVAGDVRFIGYVPQAEVADFYRAADLFVYPSLYEGFGLPPLEAMACGTPVITSNASSLPEVVGDAGLMIAPEDERALADAIVRAITDRALRDEMRGRGLARAKLFSWEGAARETAALYREALNA